MVADDAYAYCATLTRDQWAWEFLRRNPQYQADYTQFIAIWRALEADYGAPPNRDFTRWKQDPRAYGPLDAATTETLNPISGDLCIGEDDRVFIECWMGAKWGFHKFPLDPERVVPGPDELSWRPPPQSDVEVGEPYRLDIRFDLSLPLPPQLDAAKFRLVCRGAEDRGESTRTLDCDAAAARWRRSDGCGQFQTSGRSKRAGCRRLSRDPEAGGRQFEIRTARCATGQGCVSLFMT